MKVQRHEEPDADLLATKARFEQGAPADLGLVARALEDVRLARSTRRQYQRWQDKFAVWRSTRTGNVDADEVARYLAFLYLSGKGGQAGMAKAALLAHFPELAASVRLRKLAAGIESQWRLSGGGRPPRDALPLFALKEFIRARPPDLDQATWLRLRFLALLSTRTMRRLAEIEELQREHVEWDHDKSGRTDWLSVSFAKSKNDRHGVVGKRFWAPIDPSHTPDICMRQVATPYLLARGSAPGPLWLDAAGVPVPRGSVNELGKDIGRRSGVKGLFKGYSFRIAGVSLAAAAGMSNAEIQAIGGWRSEAMHVYVRALGSAGKGASARMGL